VSEGDLLMASRKVADWPRQGQQQRAAKLAAPPIRPFRLQTGQRPLYSDRLR
jgi:hypothetical protein